MTKSEKNNELKKLWTNYGGGKAFLCSPYLWLAFMLALTIMGVANKEWVWYSKALGILPNLIGFSLGGYAVMLAFGDERFLKAIKGKRPEEDASPYMRSSASLAYFVLIQIVALLVSIFFDASEISSRLFNFLGCWLFIYSLLLGIAATLRIFFLSRMYDQLPPEDNSHE